MSSARVTPNLQAECGSAHKPPRIADLLGSSGMAYVKELALAQRAYRNAQAEELRARMIRREISRKLFDYCVRRGIPPDAAQEAVQRALREDL